MLKNCDISINLKVGVWNHLEIIDFFFFHYRMPMEMSDWVSVVPNVLFDKKIDQPLDTFCSAPASFLL